MQISRDHTVVRVPGTRNSPVVSRDREGRTGAGTRGQQERGTPGTGRCCCSRGSGVWENIY